MTAQRAFAGLGLLCALIFCAIAAPSASAQGTTAFTCEKGGGALDFSDAHCDNKVTAGTGTFGHVIIAENLGTPIVTTNEKTKNATTNPTPVILKGKETEIECTKFAGTAAATNIVDANKVMQNEGTKVVIELSGCTVKAPVNCKVKEPVKFTGTHLTTETLEKTEMAIEYKPAGEHFMALEFEGAGCEFDKETHFVDGRAFATGKRGSAPAVTSTGATLLFSATETKATLGYLGNPFEIEATFTTRMEPKGGVEQNPISFTTTTP